jgi:hypothetical protein
MHAQIITYQLNDISQAEYLKQMVEPDAPILADVSGLISKVWLADEEKNTFDLQEKLCAWPVRSAVPRGGRTPFAQ